MYRQYTRETPARRGLAPVASAAAFLGSMILAWQVVTGALPGRHSSMRQAFEGWPFRFAIPGGYELQSARSLLEDAASHRVGGEARFKFTGERGAARSLEIEYHELPPETTWEDVRRLYGVPDFVEAGDHGESDEQELGEAHWALSAGLRWALGGLEWKAVCLRPGGLVVIVRLNVVGMASEGAEVASEMVAVCRSVRFR